MPPLTRDWSRDFKKVIEQEGIIASVLDRVLEKELKDALLRFEQELHRAGLADENVKSRVRGAKKFVAFLYGRYLGKYQRT
jgi:hypothetical protein